MISVGVNLTPNVRSPRFQRPSQPPHDLHVLLRHRLLRQPGGFEGLVPLRVLVDVGDLAVPQPEVQVDAEIDL